MTTFGNIRRCTHCSTATGAPVFPITGGTDAPNLGHDLDTHTTPEKDETSRPIDADRASLALLPTELLLSIVYYIGNESRSAEHSENMSQETGNISDSASDSESEGSTHLVTVGVQTKISDGDALKKIWKDLSGFNGSCRRLHVIALNFLIDTIDNDSPSFEGFRRISYEPTADSLATLKAVIMNPQLASLIEELEVVAFKPHALLANETHFKTKLRQTLHDNKYFMKYSEFERDCAIHAHWLESREYLFEQLHMLSRHHDEDILRAAKPLMTSLKKLKYTCHRPVTRSYWAHESMFPDFGETVRREPIKTVLLHQQTEYRGLVTLMKVFAHDPQIDSLRMSGIDLDIAKVNPTGFEALQSLIARVQYLELECAPSPTFRANDPVHRMLAARCQALFSGAHNVQHLVLGFDRNSMRIIPGGQHTFSKYVWPTTRQSQLLRAILQHLHAPQLNKLMLHWISANPQMIARFLDRHRSSLHRLQMSRIMLVETVDDFNASWRGITDEIERMPHIEQAYITENSVNVDNGRIVYDPDDCQHSQQEKDICRHSLACEHRPHIRVGAELKKWFREYRVRDE